MSDAVDALIRISALVEDALARRAGERGVSPIQARMLRALRAASPTINELANALGLDKSSASGLVARAERRGLVRRVRSQLDRRSVRVRLTAEGRALAGDVWEQQVADVAALLAPLPAEDRGVLASVLGAALRD